MLHTPGIIKGRLKEKLAHSITDLSPYFAVIMRCFSTNLTFASCQTQKLESGCFYALLPSFLLYVAKNKHGSSFILASGNGSRLHVLSLPHVNTIFPPLNECLQSKVLIYFTSITIEMLQEMQGSECISL